jgi:hypothetical protein
MTKPSRRPLLILFACIVLFAVAAGVAARWADAPLKEAVSAKKAHMKTTPKTARAMIALTVASLCVGAMSPRAGVIAGGMRAAAGGGTSPGLTNIVAWYDFADNTDADGGTYNLLPQNSPAFTAGPPSYGTATNGTPGAYWQQTSLDDNFGNVAGDWSMVIRFRALAGISSGDFIFTSNGGRFRVEYNTTSLRGQASGGVVTSAVAPTTDTWYTVVLVRDNTAGTSSISVNGGTFVTVSAAGSFATGTAFFGASSSANSNPCDIDFAGFWGKVLTQDNVTWLYNSGGTRTYSQL